MTAGRGRGRLLRPVRAYEVLVVLQVIVVIVLIRGVARIDLSVFGTLADTRVAASFLSLFVLAALLVRVGAAAVRRGTRHASRYVRAFVRPDRILDTVRLVVVLSLATYGYSWLKVSIPLLSPALWDGALARLDAAAHFGLDVNRFALEILPFPPLLRFLDLAYGLFVASILAAAGWFATGLSTPERTRFASGLVVLWLAAAWLYLALPSLGPCYAFPEDYAEARRAMPLQTFTQERLIRQYREVRGLRASGRGGMALDPVLGVAAMPSLHVAAQAYVAFFARRRNRFLFLLYALAAALTFYGSLVTGWHYAVDGYAGLAMGWLASRVAGRPPGRRA
ncbi:MAG: phosphatase PAP2 family protein [Thermoanaerobaculia bacterium]